MTLSRNATAGVVFLLLAYLSSFAQDDGLSDRNLKADVDQIALVASRAPTHREWRDAMCDALTKGSISTLTVEERKTLLVQCAESKGLDTQFVKVYAIWRELYMKVRSCDTGSLTPRTSDCSGVTQRFKDQTASLLKVAGLTPTTPEAQFEPGRWFKNGLVSVRLGVKYGYADKTGHIIIQPNFLSANEFSEDLASVAVSGYGETKWGFIDTTGRFVIPPQIKYQSVAQLPGSFSEGLAQFYEGERIGFIDRAGKVVIQPQFSYACSFSGNRSGVLLQGQHIVIDRSGKAVIGPIRSGIGCFSEGVAAINTGRWGYMDSQGSILIAIQAAVDFATEFSEGLASVTIEGKCAYIDKSGRVSIPPFACLWAGPFKEGLARVEMKGPSWGYIDKTGKFAIPVQFTNAEDFSEGLAHVETGLRHRFVDRNGKTVLSSVADDKESWPSVP